MNKAFLKEPDARDPGCPRCGSLGSTLDRRTAAAHCPPAALEKFSTPVYFCGVATCVVAYFDAWGSVVLADLVRNLPWPKDAAGPVCACRNLSAAEIIRDAKAGERDRVRELLHYAESKEAQCEALAADGRRCVAAVRKLFLDHYQPR